MALPSAAPGPIYPESEEKRTQLLCVLVITTTLALTAFAMRIYTRLRIVKNIGWDDYTMIAAIFFTCVVAVFESLALSNGIGTHKTYLKPDNAIEAAKWATLTITPNVLATMMARISLCLMMLRIVGRNKIYRWFLFSIIVGTALVGTLTVLNTYITCQPVAKIWNAALKGTCNSRSRYAIGMTQSVWTISADWLVALFPIVMLSKLQMAFKTKAALAIIMCLGFLIGVIVLLKTLKVGALFSRKDSTYDGADLATWSIVEQNIGIMLVNVPAIRPLFSRVFGLTKKGSNTGGSYEYSGGGYKMNNLSGRSGLTNGFKSSVVAISSHRKGQQDLDPSGSESSLVAKDSGGGITKTVGVEVRCFRNGHGSERNTGHDI